MKRKHSELNDKPSETRPQEAENAENGDGTSKETTTFTTMGLDPRILQAIVKLKFASPTLVQEKAIPLALEGKDILGMDHALRFAELY